MIRGLVKPRDDLQNQSITTPVESLCTPYNWSCKGTFSLSCAEFTGAGDDHDILF